MTREKEYRIVTIVAFVTSLTFSFLLAYLTDIPTGWVMALALMWTYIAIMATFAALEVYEQARRKDQWMRELDKEWPR